MAGHRFAVHKSGSGSLNKKQYEQLIWKQAAIYDIKCLNLNDFTFGRAVIIVKSAQVVKQEKNCRTQKLYTEVTPPTQK